MTIAHHLENCKHPIEPCICERMDSGPHKQIYDLEAINKLLQSARSKYDLVCEQQLAKLLVMAYPDSGKRPDVACIAGHCFVGKLRFDSFADACCFYELYIQASDADANYLPF
jgi:hypothetical protein